MRIRTVLLASSLTALFSATASAFVPTKGADKAFETADTIRPARQSRTPVRVAPMHASVAVQRAVDAGFGHLLWDRDTDSATQLWGAGMAAPGANASAAAAEDAARRFLTAHLELLAPGAVSSDFVLVANVARDEIRAVGFLQYKNGLRVEGGQIGFVFKNDRLTLVNSTALPNVGVPSAAFEFKPGLVQADAQLWISSVTGRTSAAGQAGEAVILPIVHPRTGAKPDIEYRVVNPVKVDLTDRSVGSWTVYIDAHDGSPVARKNRIEFVTGTLLYHIPDRYPGGTHSDHPAALATSTINGSSVTSDGAGVVTFTGANPGTVSPGLVGTRARIFNEAGSLATTSLSLAGGGTAVWDETATGARDAQLTSFIHVNLAKAYVKANITDQLTWLDNVIDVHVNEPGNCNAYSNGDDIHFFPADATCENTGRIADVVYHEFGHSVHANAIIPGVGNFDGDVSEGISDFLAATITNDHGMGRGFFFDDQPLRDLDPVGLEKKYPDDYTGEPHADGEIIAEAMWDTRKALIQSMGDPEGVRQAEKLYYHIIEASTDLLSTYAVALEADDNNGNIDDGTPHLCEIQAAFALHGLADESASMIGLSPPTVDGLEVHAPVMAPATTGTCPTADVDSATLTWKVRGTGTDATIAMTKNDLGGGNSEWVGTIPTQPDGTVVNYSVTMTKTDGGVAAFPDNAADPMYELYVGNVETIWSEAFESGLNGWTHGADQGSDQWAVGAPAGSGGDPSAAFEGSNVLGMALNGHYDPDSAQWAQSPVIDVTGRQGVRLQYRRWLGVEDGHWETASISVDGAPRWSNYDSMQGNNSTTQHVDKEWRFQDLDLSTEAADGMIQLEYRLESDPALEFAGWNIDDVRLVVPGGGGPGDVCGDGTVTGTEMCDDGNTADGDGCSATCQDETSGDDMPGMDGGCCSTGTDPSGPAVLGLLTFGLVIRRRRKK